MNMEFAKKLVLVEPETFDRISQRVDVRPNTLSLLDQEMKSVLNNKNISDYEKWLLYNQTLQRYLNIVQDTRKPFSFPIIEEPKGDNGKGDSVVDSSVVNYDQEILDSVPKTFRDKAALLLQKLKRSNLIRWDENGVVSINETRINNSNITDLINDAIRPRKNGSDPIGWQRFVKALGDTHIPFELIGNLKRREYLTGLFESASRNSTSPHNAHKPALTSHKTNKQKAKRSIPNIGWQPFRI